MTTAGLNFREDRKFDFVDAGYRALPRELATKDILMTHTSVNYDRSGFQEDINVVFPIDRLKELEASGAIGSVASINYSFMGGGMLPMSTKTARGIWRSSLKLTVSTRPWFCPYALIVRELFVGSLLLSQRASKQQALRYFGKSRSR